MQRLPAVAGQFYDGEADSLRRSLERLLAEGTEKRRALGIVSPHAGYVYSGAIAGEVFSRVKVPGRVVLLGPNHHGLGRPAAVSSASSWLTPLGPIVVDGDLAARILQGCPELTADEEAHRLEHSLEVQVPFIQFLAPAAAIVPICLGSLSLDALLRLGESLGEVLTGMPDEVLIVASSDMTHYEPGQIAREKDKRAIDRILALDPAGLYRTVRDERISMCGVLPVVVMLAAARKLGAEAATLVRYGNSGDITGDQSAVVGYAGIVVE
jgi:AmmeMemoRadiSam system protein B